MEFGEQLYLALIVLSFATFAVALAAVSWAEGRHSKERS